VTVMSVVGVETWMRARVLMGVLMMLLPVFIVSVTKRQRETPPPPSSPSKLVAPPVGSGVSGPL
jgi:hypothetical protein